MSELAQVQVILSAAEEANSPNQALQM